ncbi:MAG: hypothetical protein NW237_00065 [Cyanobacteriota bacterium]|nr:hypothetical protein [Cyanobacteriota bacterium]
MTDVLEPLAEDQWFIDHPLLHQFVATVQAARSRFEGNYVGLLAALEPPFQELLARSGWLPDPFLAPNPASGMGGGIGQWLIYRSADRSLTLFSLVVPAGSATPVHDHLAWGLIGLYQGHQEETVYQRQDDEQTSPSLSHDHDQATLHSHQAESHAYLQVAEVRSLRPGDLYGLLPPKGDIHAVKTTSPEASVSIHLLGNDTGCVWRHQFNPEAQTVRSFRSGYSNAPCLEKDPQIVG